MCLAVPGQVYYPLGHVVDVMLCRPNSLPTNWANTAAKLTKQIGKSDSQGTFWVNNQGLWVGHREKYCKGKLMLKRFQS